jgi:predicted Zn finger-like uncharacterized protein
MNIQCQQCETSYAVADDKVRGRLMKVRCKSCGEAIRVDGTLLAPAAEAPVLASRPGVDGAIWHIAVGDGTQGPYTLDELREYYAQGSVLLDTLIYREGSEEEWRPAGEVPELRASMAAPSQSGAQAFAGAVSMGSDPFGERRAGASSPRLTGAQVMEGQSEHTVQFSLDQIRALSSASAPSTSSPSMNPPRMSTSAGGYGAGTSSAYASSAGNYAAGNYASGSGYSPSSQSNAGYASGDGSGLIDVRKLAELHAAMNAEKQAVESEPLIPSTGSYAHTLAPLSLPLPPAAASQGIDGRTKVVAGLAALGMVLTAAVGVLALTRAPAAAPIAAAAPQGETTQFAAQPPSEAAPAVEEEKGERAEEQPADAKAEAAEPASDDEAAEDTARASSRSGKRSGKREARGSKREAAAADDEPIAKKEKQAKGSSKDSDIDDLLGNGPSKPKKAQSSASASIDDLLDSAVSSAVSGKKSAPKVEEKAPSSDLPTTPGRDQMLASLSKAKAKAAKCKGSGVATAQIQIAGKTGKATKVEVSGAEGSAKSCVEQAVRSTSFPKFQKDSFDVKFPFKLAS